MPLHGCFYRWWGYLAVFALCLLLGFLIGLQGVGLLLAAAAACVFAVYALRAFTTLNFRREKALLISCSILALLFLAMLPYDGRLTGHYHLYRLANLYLGLRQGSRLAGILEDILQTGLIFALVFLVVFAIWYRVRVYVPAGQKPAPSWRQTVLSTLRYALPGLCVDALYLYACWPGTLTLDSFAQWEQIENLSLLYDWHPVTHTLFEYLLTRIVNSPAIIAVFQILALMLLWGWAMAYFETRGLPRGVLFLVSCLFALLPYNGILPVDLWKDILYSIFNFLLVFQLGMIWASGGGWLSRRRNQVALSLGLALPFLFRHNGLIVLILVPPALLLLYRQHWKTIAAVTAAAVLLVVGIRNGLAFGLLKAERNPDAVMYVVPVQHIGAVLNAGGSYTPEQKKLFERVAPISTWQSAYNPYTSDSLTKPWGAVQDEKILDKIGENKTALLRAFLAYTVRYPLIVAKSELDLMSMLWIVTEPGSDFRYNYAAYAWESATPGAGTLKDLSIFVQPNLHSPLGKFLYNLLLQSQKNELSFSLIWRGWLYLFLTLAFIPILCFTKGRQALILFVPSIANVLSLTISMPIQNFRYVYPYVLCTFLIVLFAFARRDDCDAIKN